MTIHVMLDLETMGNTPDAAIMEIGACSWNPETQETRTFECKVDLETAVAAGGQLSVSTIFWWMQQKDEARKRFAPGTPHVFDMAGALALFTRWMTALPTDAPIVWGNGATADNVWLRRAYERTHQEAPWNFRNDRCYRTLKNLLPHVKGGPNVGVYHSALGDAQWQMEHLQRLLAVLPVPLVPFTPRGDA